MRRLARAGLIAFARWITVIGLLLGPASFSMADESDPYYVAGAIGGAFAHFKSVYDVPLTPPVTTSTKSDNFTAGFAFGVGLTRYLALETGIGWLGSFTETASSGRSSVTDKVSVFGGTFTLVGAIPLGPNYALELGLGPAWVDVKSEATLVKAQLLPGESSSRSVTQFIPQARVGLLYRLGYDWTLLFEAQEYFGVGSDSGTSVTGKSDLTTVTIGVRYHY
jgi:OmpA-like transmembrane domain